MLVRFVLTKFVLTKDLVYPGPVGIDDANGDQINFMGEVTFKIIT